MKMNRTIKIMMDLIILLQKKNLYRKLEAINKLDLMLSVFFSVLTVFYCLSRLYVHSAVGNWKKCLHSIKLKDSVLSLV